MLFIGENSTCTTQPPNQIIIKLHRYPPLGSSIHLLDNAIPCSTETSQAPLFVQGFANVTATHNLQPQVRVSFSDFSSCAPINLDASNSLIGTAPIQLSWTLIHPIDNSTRDFQSILQSINDPRVFINHQQSAHSNVAEGTQLIIRLKVVNVLNISSHQDLLITKKSGNPPTITLAHPPVMSIFAAKANTFSASAYLYSCDGTKSQSPIKWKMQSDNTAELNLAKVTQAMLQQPNLVLPPNTLRKFINQNITVSAVAQSSPASISSVASTQVLILASPITAALSGINTVISSSLPHTITATIHDPDELESVIKLVWAIQNPNANGNDEPKAIIIQANSSITPIYVESNSYPTGKYDFNLHVEKNGRLAFATGWIRFVDETPISASITTSSTSRFVDTRKSLSLSANSPECEQNSGCSYFWTLVSQNIPENSKILDATRLSSARLVFNPNTFEQDKTYTFGLNITKNARWGYAEVMMQTTPGPFGGRIEISPTSGRALSTTFQIDALGWNTEPELMPLRYEFRYKQSDGNYTLLSASGTNNIDVLFPAGAICERVDVSNSGGGTAVAEGCLFVEAMSQNESAQMAIQLSQALFSSGSADAESVFTKCGVILDVIGSVSAQSSNSSSQSQLAGVARNIMAQSSALFSSAPKTEGAVASVSKIMAAGSVLVSSQPDTETLDSLSETTSLILQSLEDLEASPSVLQEIVANVYQVLDSVLSGRSNIRNKLNVDKIQARVSKDGYWARELDQIVGLQRVQSRQRVCGEQEFVRKLEQMDVALTSGSIKANLQVASIMGVVIEADDTQGSNECVDFGISVFSDEALFADLFASLNISTISKVVLFEKLDRSKLQSRMDSSPFNITLPITGTDNSSESFACSAFKPENGTIAVSKCEAVFSGNQEIRCICPNNGIVVGHKRTQFNSPDSQNEDEEGKQGSGNDSSILIGVSVAAVVILLALIFAYLIRHQRRSKIIHNMVLVVESDHSSGSVERVESESNPASTQQPTLPAFNRSGILDIRMMTQEVNTDFLDDDLETIPVS